MHELTKKSVSYYRDLADSVLLIYLDPARPKVDITFTFYRPRLLSPKTRRQIKKSAEQQ